MYPSIQYISCMLPGYMHTRVYGFTRVYRAGRPDGGPWGRLARRRAPALSARAGGRTRALGRASEPRRAYRFGAGAHAHARKCAPTHPCPRTRARYVDARCVDA